MSFRPCCPVGSWAFRIVTKSSLRSHRGNMTLQRETVTCGRISILSLSVSDCRKNCENPATCIAPTSTEHILSLVSSRAGGKGALPKGVCPRTPDTVITCISVLPQFLSPSPDSVQTQAAPQLPSAPPDRQINDSSCTGGPTLGLPWATREEEGELSGATCEIH